MSNKMISAFPFELAIKDSSEGQELFIKTVEQILRENLQSKKAFGCNIRNCHMHIGSKIHTEEFVEAELLFHNSYYNSHFAWLTQQYIQYKIKGNSFSSIILVGYETFGELYLLECIDLLEKTAHCPVYYCVAEAKGGRVKIRSTIPDEVFRPDQNPYYVFIVPINTTLTTHDKLMSAYKAHLRKKISDNHIVFDESNSTNLALIVIGPPNEKNDYWEEIVQDTGTEEYGKLRSLKLLDNKQKLLTELGNRSVRYFARHYLGWEKPKKCSSCYPDLKGKNLTAETPIFEVSKEAIVPILQIGIKDIPRPLNTELETDIDKNKYKNACDNIRKVIHLSSFMYARHITRNENHYQYYVDSQKYIESLEKKPYREYLDVWEKRIENELFSKNNDDASNIIYDFIVAPRHFSNAGFVHEISNNIFNESARVLYIDVNKEYRKNLVAKYSDFSAQIQKIAESRQESKIRFHFVDDMIITGTSFYRSKSLVQSLISGIKKSDKCSIELFSSVIVLVDRNSDESRKKYIDDLSRFYPYVYVSISSLRNQENSCILCNLQKSFKILRKEAAFNETSSKFKRISKKYKLIDCQKLKPKDFADDQDRLLMIVGHILEERLSNRWLYIKDSECEKRAITTDDIKINGINSEDEEKVLEVLELYYKKLDGFINLYSEKKFSTEDVEIAMIKIISRPYFTNHIRCRQASFKFCITKMAEFQKLQKNHIDKTRHIKALINALSDMNANYLFRRENMQEFLDITKLQKNYIWAIKKEISLSNDDNKSVLLEYSLVNGNEDWLLDDKHLNNSTNQSINRITHQKSWMELYFENNSVLKSSLKKARLLDKFEANKHPYYLNNFFEIMKVQGITDQNIDLLNYYMKAFSNLYDAVNVDKKKKEISDIQYVARCMIQLLCCDPGYDYKAVYVFAKAGTHSPEDINRWDRYAILDKNSKGSDIQFYSSNNLKMLDLLTGDIDVKVTSVMKTIFYINKNSEEVKGSIFEGVESTVINLYQEGDVCVFVQIDKSIDQATSSLKAIQDNTLYFLLPLKLLLCVRHEISKYMNKCNVLSYLQAKQYKDITKALSIRKATKHQDLGINEGSIPHQIMLAVYSTAKYSKHSVMDGITKEAKEKFPNKTAEFPSSFVEAYGLVANKYLQYLANEYISTFYREMVRSSSTYNNEDSVIQDEDLKIDFTHLDRVIKYLCRMGFEKNEDGTELNTVMFVPNDGFKNTHRIAGKQEIRITIHTQNFTEDRVIWTRKDGNGALTAFYYLLILSLSMNAGKHFKMIKSEERTCYVDVDIENEYLVVKNNLVGVTEDNRKKYEGLAIQRMMTPPWFFEDQSQSITLWTLHTFMEIFQKKKEINTSIPNTASDAKWIKVGIEKNDEDDSYIFEIRLRLIGNE